ncbi:MAG TPA: protein kinase [Candidatus Dormibacteraeota bacterium]|nr:protein kinase [Candidatus Dormibacteraeota bacterium]
MLPSALLSGKILARYRIIQKLGQGGFGEVYHATDLELERPVALKVLSRAAADNPVTRTQLLREARLACSLSHPHVVTIYSVDRAEDLDFIVMEYVDGRTLRDVLRNGPLPLEQVLDLGAEIADALGAAHEIGLLHRDIKPANIMITTRGSAKVLDFGLAKRVLAKDAASDSTMTGEGVVKGTVDYMSPEQTRGEPLDARSDLFSLGAVLYECATGKRPFPGARDFEVMHAITTLDPLPPSRVRDGLDAGIDPILSRALAKEVSSRYASSRELARGLRSLRKGEAGASSLTLRLPATPRSRSHNLPPELTSFIGREEEIAHIKRLFGSTRLLTLTGTGGSGKTRLALRVARDLLEGCADGVWFVDLAPLSDPSLVPQAVASALSLKEVAGKSLKETLADHLVGKSLLLVLDNCEHLVGASARLVADLLYTCPGLHVLTTSREALHVPGEVVWSIPSLKVPGASDLGAASWQRLREFESVQLFVARAEAVHSLFSLGENNGPAVAQICRGLDGIPLAIELAAARVGALPPQEILTRLEDRFRLLTKSSRGVIERQQTLRAAIDWSHDLLSDPERGLFRRLGIFAGSFGLEAAEIVCSGDGVDRSEVLDLTTKLFEKSLLVAEEDSRGTGRYRLLETLRDYARERMKAAQEDSALRRRHSEYFLSVVEQSEAELQGPDQARWFHRLDSDHENIRVAIMAAIGEREHAIASRYCGSLWRFWWVRGMWAEGRTKLGEVLEGESPPGAARLKVLHGAAVLARGQGAYDEAESLLHQGLEMARAQGEERSAASMLHELGNIANQHGNLSKASSFYEESLAISRKLGDERGASSSLHNLGVVAQSQRNYRLAQNLYEEALAMHRALGNRAWEASGLNGLGSVALAREEWATARSCHEQALAIQKELGDQWGMTFSLRELGVAAERSGAFAEARNLLVEGLRILKDLGDREGVAESLESLAGLAVGQRQYDRALRLAGAALALREMLGSPLMPADRQRLDSRLREARQGLGKQVATRAFIEGRGFSFERALQYGLAEESGASLSLN